MDSLDAVEKMLDDRLSDLSKKEKEVKRKKQTREATKLANAVTQPVVGNRSNSVESKMLQAFGVDHPAKLLGIDVSRYKHVDPSYKMMACEFKKALDICRWTAQTCYDQPLDRESKTSRTDESTKVAKVDHILETHFAKETLVPMLKSFGTSPATDGGAWIPTGVSTNYEAEFELPLNVAGAFREMPMPTNPFRLPVQDTITVARIASENSTLADNSYSHSFIEWSATKLGEFYRLPEELTADSAPAILNIAREQVLRAQIRARETLILNGDDTATHMDNDVTAATDARKLTKGLRKLAIDNSANGGTLDFNSPVTVALLDTMRTQMGRFGVNPRDLMWVFSPSGYNQIISLDEVSSLDQIGNNATLITGALANFRGIPVWVSEYVREDVAATGVNTVAGPNDKGLVYLVNQTRFWMGIRRPIQVRVQLDLPDNDRFLIASYSRVDFQGHVQDATEVSTVVGVNVTI